MKNEQALNRVLRDLPLRSAPATLEARVILQLERRRTITWWQRGFTHWPAAARVSFIGTCVAVIGASLADTRWSTLSWTYPAVGVIASAADVEVWISRSLSSNWFYAFAATAALLYATLFGLGIAAYRTLYLSPSQDR
jgi:hypothetical protein